MDLLSIYEFSKCDRRLAIICHTPSSIRCLKFNYLNQYRYCQTAKEYFLDKQHLQHINDIHLIRNVQDLSIVLKEDTNFWVSNKYIKYMKKLKHLTFYGNIPIYDDGDDLEYQIFH